VQTRYVVDTTIIVAWLLNPNNLTGKIVRSLELELFMPYMAVNELWEHRDEWTKKKPSLDLKDFTDGIGYYIRTIMIGQNSHEMVEAKRVMDKIDPDDSEFVALALKLDASIWSHDRHFQAQDRIKIATSGDILRQSHELPALWEALKEGGSRNSRPFASKTSNIHSSTQQSAVWLLSRLRSRNSSWAGFDLEIGDNNCKGGNPTA
jgi:predicted nucleic acid-binding protein